MTDLARGSIVDAAIEEVAKRSTLEPEDIRLFLQFLGTATVTTSQIQQLSGGGPSTLQKTVITFILLNLLLFGCFLIVSNFAPLAELENTFSDWLFNFSYGPVSRLEAQQIQNQSVLTYWGLRRFFVFLPNFVGGFFGTDLWNITSSESFNALLFVLYGDTVLSLSSFGIQLGGSAIVRRVTGTTVRPQAQLFLWRFATWLSSVSSGPSKEAILAFSTLPFPEEDPSKYTALESKPEVQRLIQLMRQAGIINPYEVTEPRRKTAAIEMAARFSQQAGIRKLLIDVGIRSEDVNMTLLLLGIESRRSQEHNLVTELVALAKAENDRLVAQTGAAVQTGAVVAAPRRRAGSVSSAARAAGSGTRSPSRGRQRLGGGQSTAYERLAVKFMLVQTFRLVLLGLALSLGLQDRFTPQASRGDAAPSVGSADMPSNAAAAAGASAVTVGSIPFAVVPFSKDLLDEATDRLWELPLFQDGVQIVSEAFEPYDERVTDTASRAQIIVSAIGKDFYKSALVQEMVDTAWSIFDSYGKVADSEMLRTQFESTESLLSNITSAMRSCSASSSECDFASASALAALPFSVRLQLPTDVPAPSALPSAVPTALPSSAALPSESDIQRLIDEQETILAEFNITGSEQDIEGSFATFQTDLDAFRTAANATETYWRDFKTQGVTVYRTRPDVPQTFDRAVKRLETYFLFLNLPDQDSKVFTPEEIQAVREQVAAKQGRAASAFSEWKRATDELRNLRRMNSDQLAVARPRQVSEDVNVSQVAESAQSELQRLRALRRLEAAQTILQSLQRNITDELRRQLQNTLSQNPTLSQVNTAIQSFQEAEESRRGGSATRLTVDALVKSSLLKILLGLALSAVFSTTVRTGLTGLTRVIFFPCSSCCRLGLQCCRASGRGVCGGVFSLTKVSAKAALFVVKTFLMSSMDVLQVLGDAFDDVADAIVMRTKPLEPNMLRFFLYDAMLTTIAVASGFVGSNVEFSEFVRQVFA